MAGRGGAVASRELPVQISGNGIRRKIEIDGHDITNSVLSASLEIEGGCTPILHLRLAACQLLGVDEHARVLLGSETAEALKAIGWTPPEGVG